jgi:gliding motility-associated-like protein
VSDTVVVRFHKIADPDKNLPKDTTLCEGQTILLDMGYPDATRRLWSTGDTTQTLLVSTPGNYVATVYYDRCDYYGVINVGYLKYTVDLGRDTTLCEGTVYHLDAKNPGSSYLWSTGATSRTLDVNAAGTYWVKVMNKQCAKYDTVVVKYIPMPHVDLGKDTTVCKGATVLLDAGNASSSHLWSTGDTTRTILVTRPGTYWAQANNGKCSHRDSIVVNYISIVVDLGNDQTLCQATPYVLDAKNPSADAYLWSTGETTQKITVTTKGKYWVQVRVKQCYESDTVNINYLLLDKVHLGKDTLLCAGQKITLDIGNPGLQHLWNTSDTTQTLVVSRAGAYIGTALNGKCTEKDTINVGYINFKLNLGHDTTVCEGMAVPLDAANPGSQYLWSTGETTQKINAVTPGDVWVVVKRNQCFVSDTVNLHFAPAPHLDLGKDTVLCYGGKDTLDAGNPGMDILWSTGDTSRRIPVTRRGKYWVYVTNGLCDAYDTVSVTFYPELKTSLPHEYYLCDEKSNGDSLDPGPAATYLWYPNGETTRKIFVKGPGKFSYIMKNEGGCTLMDSVTVLECPANDIYIPNAFSPDEDEINPVFKVYNLNAVEYEMKIYNRWGEVIFTSDSPEKGWDGNIAGKPATESTYIWTVKYRLKTSYGEPPLKIISGSVMLLRH